MKLGGHTEGWWIFFLAATIPGFHLQRIHSPVYQSILQSFETLPPTGTYTLRKADGTTCVKITMGVQYVIYEKKTWYYSLDPSRIRTDGHCGKEEAVLSLTLSDNAAFLQFTIAKDKNVVYIAKLTAHLSPFPVCHGCANKTYFGLLDHSKLFIAAHGGTFKCKSENVLLMSSEMKLRLVPLQIQAFTLPTGPHGNDVECLADYNKRITSVALVAIAVGVALMVVLIFLLRRDHQYLQEYQRI
ncbi:lysosome-associated membrane glycoprotein 3 [Cynoglossus semilaevis]|uniref:Lysosome-associated membrane glycoprotein 3 n=1 Tax=Cynoglossus semilaevis TaxID=244447 RepID=A0A3P8WUL5_CYNSE|nr:lysosome-associated membrane glycoprotein 3 [Cynoglossus semilaevis]